jgi:hypothetical protein
VIVPGALSGLNTTSASAAAASGPGREVPGAGDRLADGADGGAPSSTELIGRPSAAVRVSTRSTTIDGSARVLNTVA